MNAIHHSGHILILARRAYERALSDGAEAMPGIVLAAVAVECYLNDFSERIASHLFRFERAEYQEAAHWLGVLETEKASTLSRFEAIHFIFVKAPVDRGSQPYQDLNFLFQLRNAFVHRRPEHLAGWDPGDPDRVYEPHRYVRQLASRGIIELPSPNAPPVWSQFVLTATTAKWAYNTAVNVFHYVANLLPTGNFSAISSQLIQGVVAIR